MISIKDLLDLDLLWWLDRSARMTLRSTCHEYLGTDLGDLDCITVSEEIYQTTCFPFVNKQTYKLCVANPCICENDTQETAYSVLNPINNERFSSTLTIIVLSDLQIRSLYGLGSLHKVKEFTLNRCHYVGNLVFAPPCCENVVIHQCRGLVSVRGLPKNVTQLKIEDCQALVTLKGLSRNMEVIVINNCQSLCNISDISSIRHLKACVMRECGLIFWTLNMINWHPKARFILDQVHTSDEEDIRLLGRLIISGQIMLVL